MPGEQDQGMGLDRGNPSQGADAGNGAAGKGFVTGLPNEAGSGAPPASQEGAQGQQQSAQAGGDTTTPILPGYGAALPKELKADPKVVSFMAKYPNGWGDIVKSAMEAESKLGGMISIPKEGSSPEETAAFYKKLGVPEKPEDYKLTAKNVAPEQLAEFAKIAHKLHLPPKEAQALVTEAANGLEAMLVRQAEKNTADSKAAESTLKKDWGNAYDQNVTVMQKGYRAASTQVPGFAELSKEWDATGLSNNPAMAKFLHWVGTLFSEDTSPASGPSRKPSANGEKGFARPGL